ncbi:PIN domain-containing protein [Quisquiliibacterium transsilvanicum]|jgi:predicted nucleic acid-binding protein|uniref:Putative nucleic acid-binding protein n=1 Tax=Quisquiliibacterium transsilvanicum TaxID=1549638 RepID=A0A7W8HJL2_9BURK|nr:PIN domain-containing protein [Quisquiliibacterium transsilvanicum]MBB5273123.1 putative nucleic acid-binding protein [Quisquiliibacterium transsilvanicum]
MSRQAVIVDTNVVVAGLLTGNAASPVARILDGMLTGAFTYALSEALLAEYRTVLVRPQLCKLHGLSVTEIDALLTDIAFNAIVLAPAPARPAPDPGDQLLWELLAARPELLLVTGDKLLLRDPGMGGRVIEPAAFAAAF